MATYARNPVEFVRGEGTRLWDAEGNEYLDFLAGISVVQLGHCHPARGRGRDASRPAGSCTWATSSTPSPAMRLAERLSELLARRQGVLLQLRRRGDRVRDQARAPAPAPAASSWCWRAASTAARWARCRPRRRRPSRRRSRRSCPGFTVVPRDDADALAAAVERATRPPCCIEPIQGESGIHPLDAEMLRGRARGLRRARRAADLRRDPVRHGPHRARCGRGEQLGVAPDVMTVAKGLGGGLPIGACVDRARATPTCSQPGDHGSTFAGGPVIAAAANAVLDVVDDDGLPRRRCAREGERLAAGLRDLGLEPRGARPDARLRPADDAPDAGAPRCCSSSASWCNATGPDTIRLLPPLTVSRGRDRRGASRRLGAALR